MFAFASWSDSAFGTDARNHFGLLAARGQKVGHVAGAVWHRLNLAHQTQGASATLLLPRSGIATQWPLLTQTSRVRDPLGSDKSSRSQTPRPLRRAPRLAETRSRPPLYFPARSTSRWHARPAASER